MSIDVTRLDPPPKRLGSCGACPYRESGTSAICSACAQRSLVPLADLAARCQVCDLELGLDKICGNPLCSWTDRQFEWNFSMSSRAGVLKQIVSAYKFQGARGWSLILGRLVVGFLDENASTFREFDVILPTPAYIGPGAERSWDHAREVVTAAHSAAAGLWPFEPEQVLSRTSLVPKFTGRKWSERFELAKQLRESLRVLRPDLVRGKRVLVYDDIFTEGLTLNEVARALRHVGATSVCGITLMRQPWTSRSPS